MKKILYVTPFNFYPPTTGGSRFIYNYIRTLSAENSVFVAGLKNQDSIERIKTYKVFSNNLTKYFNPGDYFKLYKILLAEKPQEIIIAMPYQGIIVALLSKAIHAKCYLHEQNIEFLRFKTFKKPWWPLMYLYELAVYNMMDKILIISDSDKSLIKKHFKINESKLENAYYKADASLFKPDNNARKKIREKLGLQKDPIVLFFGPLDYQPNKEALNIIINEIAPKVWKKNGSVQFLIVGKNPPTLKIKNIIFTGFVDDIADYINASDVVIVPLLSGGGIRTKIIESMSCKKTVIATSLAAEGIVIDKSNSKSLIISDLRDFDGHIVKEINTYETTN